MADDKLKKILAACCMATLISGSAMLAPYPVQAQSG